MMKMGLRMLGYAGARMWPAAKQRQRDAQPDGRWARRWLMQQLQPKDCGKINRFAEAIGPLPPRNTSLLLSLIVELGLSSRRDQSLQMCDAGQQ